MGLCLFLGKKKKYGPFLHRLAGGMPRLDPLCFRGKDSFFYILIGVCGKGVTPLTSFNDVYKMINIIIK